MLGLDEADLLIGVDDTDNLESRGTGYLVQRLIAWLPGDGLGHACGATRHQFLVDPRIPYTSHNSGACIGWASQGARIEDIIDACAWFLANESASGSDPGLAVVDRDRVVHEGFGPELIRHGRAAKERVLNKSDAEGLAARAGVHLSEHGGDGGGVIGALASAGLHLEGEDGFFLWMPRIRDLPWFLTFDELRAATTIQVFHSLHGGDPDPSELVALGDWVRPIFHGGRSMLLIEAVPGDESSVGERWRVSPKATVKAYAP